jgi:hypothetical protein
MEISTEAPRGTKNRIIIWFCYTSLGHISEGTDTIHNSQAMQSAQQQWMGTESVVCTHNGALCIEKEEWKYVFRKIYRARHLMLDNISKTWKDKYCMFSLLWNLDLNNKNKIIIWGDC